MGQARRRRSVHDAGGQPQVIVEVHDLWKRYGRFDALHGLEFGIPEGSAFALVGPNGAGKTTTIKILVNLLQPSRGDAARAGRDRLCLRKPGSARRAERRRIPRLPAAVLSTLGPRPRDVDAPRHAA